MMDTEAITRGGTLSDAHRESLVSGSGIDPEAVAERGYFTAYSPDELISLGFAEYQALTPALVIPVWGAAGKLAFYRCRPDNPRTGTRGRAVKYEQPPGTPLVLDVPRRSLGDLADTSCRLWVTEGEKKADALASHGECAIALLGVWGWKRGGLPLPCWDRVHLVGREVYVCFDSDATRRVEVRRARRALAEYLDARGAT
jgi:hypothetical protein